ncbi:MAG: hypothetical protein WCD49_04330 [Candidatus Acidiferrales bacterium]
MKFADFSTTVDFGRAIGNSFSEKLSAAEGAMFVRMQKLNVSPDGHQEPEAIRQACEELLKIQTQRLRWPVPNGILSDRAE